MQDVLIEDLYKELEDILEKIDGVVEQVQTQKLSAFDGFMQTEDLRTRANELLHEFEKHGIDVAKKIEEAFGGKF